MGPGQTIVQFGRVHSFAARHNSRGSRAESRARGRFRGRASPGRLGSELGFICCRKLYANGSEAHRGVQVSEISSFGLAMRIYLYQVGQMRATNPSKSF